MGAAVDKGLYRARFVSIEDDRDLADIARAEIARFGDLGLESEKPPHRPAEDPLLLARIDLGVVVEPIRHPAVVERRPDRSGYHRYSRIIESPILHQSRLIHLRHQEVDSDIVVYGVAVS